jgi:hypothetical protein
VRDILLAGRPPENARKLTLLSGAGALVRGTVLGQITKAAGTAAKESGTGDGVVSGFALGPQAEIGVYILTGLTEAANLGTFMVQTPSGHRLADLLVATPYVSPHFNLTVADGANDWDIGDLIHAEVVAGSGKYLKSLAAAVDGSQVPDAVLAEDRDATSADKEAIGYFEGRFNDLALTLGAGHTVASIREGLRIKGIHLLHGQEA